MDLKCCDWVSSDACWIGGGSWHWAKCERPSTGSYSATYRRISLKVWGVVMLLGSQEACPRIQRGESEPRACRTWLLVPRPALRRAQ